MLSNTTIKSLLFLDFFKIFLTVIKHFIKILKILKIFIIF